MKIETMAGDIHARQLKWWYNNHELPEAKIKLSRDLEEEHHRTPKMVSTSWAKLALIYGEISELNECEYGQVDDKLTQHYADSVELADIWIRSLDYGAGVNIPMPWELEDLDSAAEKEFEEEGLFGSVDSDIDWLCMRMNNKLSLLTETERKNSHDLNARSEAMRDFLISVLLVSICLGNDDILMNVVEDKLKFNSTRPDHQIENMKSTGGKIV